MSEWQAHVSQQDRLRRIVTISIYREGPGWLEVYRPDGMVTRIADNEGVAEDASELWKLPVEAVSALFAALNRHQGGIDNPTTLRADYLAERARVDKLTDAVIGAMRGSH